VALTPAPHQAEALGLEVRELSDDVASQLQVPGTRGVVVTNVTPESRGAQAGLRPGSVIVEVNRQPVTNGDEFRAAVNSADGSNLLLLVRSSAGSQFVVVPAE